MIKGKRVAVIRNFITAASLIILATAVNLYFPEYRITWSQNLSIILFGLLLLLGLTPAGGEIVGDPAVKMPLIAAIKKIVLSYCILGLFIFSFLILLMTAILSPDPAEVVQVFEANFATISYQQIASPWILYAFGAAIIAAIGYKVHKPKMSGSLASIITSKYLGGFFAAVIDFIAMMGFFLGILAVIGVSAMALSKLVATFFAYSLNYTPSIVILGLGFALVYLPFSSLWKTLVANMQQKQLSLGATFLLFLMGFGFFIIAIYGAVYGFVNLFSDYFAPFQKNLTRTLSLFYFGGQLQEVSIGELLWGIGMITTAVVAGWWLQYVQGYTLRMAILLLLAPFFIVWGAVELFHYLLPASSLTVVNAFIVDVLWWCSTSPQSYIIGMVSSIILILGMRKENNFIKGLFWVMPNLAGKKLSRWRNVIIRNGNFIVMTVVFSILAGISFIQILIFLFAVLFTIVISLAILSVIKYLLIRKIS